MLLNQAQLDQLTEAIARSSGIDGELIAVCGPAVRVEQYDHAVASAFKVLEGSPSQPELRRVSFQVSRSNRKPSLRLKIAY